MSSWSAQTERYGRRGRDRCRRAEAWRANFGRIYAALAPALGPLLEIGEAASGSRLGLERQQLAVHRDRAGDGRVAVVGGDRRGDLVVHGILLLPGQRDAGFGLLRAAVDLVAQRH